MNLLLIGHSVEDHIFYKGTETIKPGGMFYTASGMLGIKDDGDEISIITSIDENSYHLFKHVYENADTSLSERGSDIIPIVRLDIYDDKERDEKYNRLGNNLTVPYNQLNKFDGILINMITGFDITLEQLKDIRKKSTSPVYMDVHTLSRGVDNELRRPQRIIDNFDEWSTNIDIIQVNENEIFSLHNLKSERDIAYKVLDSGTKFLIVTKGDKGASLYYKKKNELSSCFVSSLKINVRNKVGCGDIFGTVFFHSFIKFNSAILALKLANTAAGIVSSYDNEKDIGKLKNDVFARHN